MAQTNKEQRIIEIIADGQKFNSSIKEMSAAAAVMANQIKKMAADDPGREALIQQLQEMKSRIKAATDEVNGLNKAQETLAQTEAELHQANQQLIADGSKVNASLNEMKVAAGLLEKQLADMATDDPNRQKMAADFRELKTRIEGTTEATFKYIKSQEELHQETVTIIADGKQLGASFDQMEAAAKAMEKQLKSMSASDPSRGELIKDFNSLKERAQEAGNEINGIAKAQSGFAGLMKDTWSQAFGFVLGGGIIGITQQIWGLFTSSKQAFEESAIINSQLEASLKSTGESAGVTKEMIEELATVQMGKTLFDDDVTKKAASLLLTFTDIKNGVFQEALPAIQDMAQKMAGEGPADLKGATIQVGKALNDPIKGITALSKVGVSFTEEQKKVIKSLVETGDKAGAQRMILAELNKEFGGSAEAARKAGGGMAELKMQMGEAQEELGSLVHDGLEIMAPLLLKVFRFTAQFVGVLREAPTFIKENKDLFIALGIAILGLQFNTAKAAATTLYHTAVEKGRSIATRIATLEQWNLNAAFSANPIGFVISAVALLVGGFVMLYNRSQTVRAGIAGIWEVLQNLGGRLADLFTGLATGNWSKVKAAFSNIGGSIAESFNKGYDDKVAAEDAARLKKEQNKAAQKKKDAAKRGEEEAKAETEAQRKAREKAEKEAEKKRKEHLEKLKEARVDFDKSEAQADLEFTKLKIEAMDEGIEKVLAQLRHQHALEKAELEKQKKDALGNIAATQQEKQVLVAKYNEEQKLQDEILRKAEAAAVKEDNEKKLKEVEEQSKKEQELRNRLLLAYADMDVAKAAKSKDLEAMEKAELARLALKKEIELQNETLTAEEKLLIQEQYEQQRLDLTTQYADLRNASEREKAVFVIEQLQTATQTLFDFKKIASDKELARVDRDKNERLKKLDQEYEHGMISKDFYESSKAKIEANYDEKAKELKRKAAKDEKAANVANSIMTGILAVLKAAPNIPLQILTGIFAAASTAKILATPIPAFATGGLTSNDLMGLASGQTGGVTGSFAGGGMVNSARLGLIGEKGAELVIPNWMIKSPKYANTVGWLESERQRGVTAFAAGGSTTGEPVAAPQEVPGLTPGEQAILGAIQSMHTTVQAWPKQLQVHNNVVDAAEKLKEYYDLHDQASA